MRSTWYGNVRWLLPARTLCSSSFLFASSIQSPLLPVGRQSERPRSNQLRQYSFAATIITRMTAAGHYYSVIDDDDIARQQQQQPSQLIPIGWRMKLGAKPLSALVFSATTTSPANITDFGDVYAASDAADILTALRWPMHNHIKCQIAPRPLSMTQHCTDF